MKRPRGPRSLPTSGAGESRDEGPPLVLVGQVLGGVRVLRRDQVRPQLLLRHERAEAGQGGHPGGLEERERERGGSESIRYTALTNWLQHEDVCHKVSSVDRLASSGYVQDHLFI